MRSASSRHSGVAISKSMVLMFVFAGLALVGVHHLKQALLTVFVFAISLTLWDVLAYIGIITM